MNKKTIRTISLVLFVAGITIALTAGALLFFGILPSPISAIIGIVGMDLITMSNFKLIR